MGERDSSLTRVQPVFGNLFQRTTANWLPALIALGSRSTKCHEGRFDWVGSLRCDPPTAECFEWSVLSPVDYLKALLVSTDRLSAAAKAKPSILKSSKDPVVEKKRKSLIAGDPETIAEGLGKLDSGYTRSAKGTWWVLEGTTKVDCAIFAEKASIFIEGKRTEPKLTDSVAWDLKRNQVFRNLDALRMVHYLNTEYYVLLIVEANSKASREAEKLDSGYEVAVPSWPHLSDNEARSLYEKHYLGYTTWQAVADRFGITMYNRICDQPDSL